ncbi:2OG-Fe(II) oxygenase [Dyadobacter sp. Leaf189]|uniref:2OG-Fe(II) oxygenase n=1 Tax=Dyadobacter sp. Leaf189 TaxID=1736295 RepID=UPI0006FA4F03|nr:2OG-Fe(II) oxygenase [Dyadobacter sp. Leaf189]KQS28226.1 prolyl 4-hydroxylase subunit alpha [Dyadobacter sp. Leaf189]
MRAIQNTEWQTLANSLNNNGSALVRQAIDADECSQLISQYGNADLYRKTVVMERYRFGLGEYKYFNYPLPALIGALRENYYPNLVPVANNWMQQLGISQHYPNDFAEFLEQCSAHGQIKPTALILKYGEGGHNTLHQDLYGDVFFPIQMVLFLNQAGQDYTGGEFVLTQQIPRAQSKAIVVQPNLGDILVFTTNFRPIKGTRGYFRANMKHGVSQVHTGSRYTLGIIFHDALS